MVVASKEKKVKIGDLVKIKDFETTIAIVREVCTVKNCVYYKLDSIKDALSFKLPFNEYHSGDDLEVLDEVEAVMIILENIR